jgi:DNA-binding transcriptional ArsR family regulator
VAHHLEVLREAGMLCAEKIGNEVRYRRDADAVRVALTAVLAFLAAA